ncbi:hypothetical protein [Nocardioides daphniae]|uniref:Uncharacterized protein n=1 Tax=Nocardioides daphniae TaxID=402297 RepID=A0A4P7UA07_9ACTN|nr:hypothetical protein [Nocardioides daphniae]QCC76125.1 hypothetical protein E2C04_00985 [Nocardioides daphniae]GGD09885.1 hypothetical protein GCM10007231_05890 [Nocardioides daphniae]
MAEQTGPGVARAWGWVAHLRTGGTTPWAGWSGDADPTGRVLPGAQQLELLRRINLAADGLVPEELVERVLAASAPGRGRAELELVGAAYDARFGAPPVDPSDLPAEEVVRVAAHLLAQDLVALGPLPRPVVRQRPWRRRVMLVGDPWLRSEVTRQLIDAGRAPRPGGRVVVVGADLPRMLADAWTNACFDRPVGSWDEWLGNWRNRRGLPPGLQLGQLVEHWREVAGDRNVELVLDERRLSSALRGPQVERVRRPGRTAAGLARRVAFSLSLMIPVSERRTLLRDGLLPRIPDEFFDVGLPALPPEHEEWVRTRGDRLAEQLREAGYPVRDSQWSGGAQPQAPGTHPAAGGDRAALDLAVGLLLGGWKAQP